jgi:hypothetical protein
MRSCNSFFNLATAYIVGVVGYHLNNHSLTWGIVDALFYPIAIIKWLICGELSMSLIKESFPFFFQ